MPKFLSQMITYDKTGNKNILDKSFFYLAQDLQAVEILFIGNNFTINNTEFQRIYWGDGTYDDYDANEFSHEYLRDGAYHICIFGVTSIGAGAFSGCSGLTDITIPDSVTSIGAGAFSGCSGLTDITIPFVGGSKSADTASESTLLGYIFGEDSYDHGEPTEQKWGTASTDKKTYYIPEFLKNVIVTGGDILYGAFYNCSSLTSIVIPDSITNIGVYAFYNCSSLTNITIPNRVIIIGNFAFYNCNSLTSTTFENINGWKVYLSEQSSTPLYTINSDDLSDSSTAASLITNEVYSILAWKRSDS